jgi:hypothetical protein
LSAAGFRPPFYFRLGWEPVGGPKALWRAPGALAGRLGRRAALYAAAVALHLIVRMEEWLLERLSRG